MQVVGQAELLPNLLAKYTWRTNLKNAALISFVDDDAARHAVISNSTPSLSSFPIISHLACMDSKLNILSWTTRVPSASDGPKGLVFSQVRAMGATERQGRHWSGRRWPQASTKDWFWRCDACFEFPSFFFLKDVCAQVLPHLSCHVIVHFTLQLTLRGLKFCIDTRFMTTVDVGQHVMIKNTEEFSQFTELMTCRGCIFQEKKYFQDQRLDSSAHQHGTCIEKHNQLLGVAIGIESVNNDNFLS